MAGFQNRVMRVINRFASAYRRGLRPYLARCFDRYREAYRRVAQSRICTTVLRLVQTIRSGVGPGGLRPLLRFEEQAPNQRGCSIDTSIAQNVRRPLVTKQPHQLVLVTASLQFVEERSEPLVIESQCRPRRGGVRRG
jgi:hypothetical protein